MRYVIALVALLASQFGFAAEWLPTNGNMVNGVTLYGAMSKDDGWRYGAVICWTMNGAFLVQKKNGSHIIVDPMQHAVLMASTWIAADDPALKLRQVTTCTEEQIIKVLD